MTDAAGRYLNFGRDEWAELRAATPMTLSESDLDSLRGINESIELDEVATIYLPLTRLLNLYVSGDAEPAQGVGQVPRHDSPKVPYIIGVAGSVAVGKSTFARTSCRRCWRIGPTIPRSTWSPPTVFCTPTRCSKSAAS